MAQKLSVNPWLEMWVHPRETIRAIVKFNVRYLFAVIAAVYGLPVILQFHQNMNIGAETSIWITFLIALILSPFVGMIALSAMAGLLYWTGKWIGGKASYLQVRAATAWSQVTSLGSIVVWLMMMAVFGADLFSASFGTAPFIGHEVTVLFIGFIIQVVTSIWGIVIFLNALGEVQGFSSWKALLNIAIPFFMVMIVLWILMSLGMSLFGGY